MTQLSPIELAERYQSLDILHGFGLFARLEKKFQIVIVVLVWFVQIILKQIWLKFYKFGPLEWLWRSLTYLKRQPFKKALQLT